MHRAIRMLGEAVRPAEAFIVLYQVIYLAGRLADLDSIFFDRAEVKTTPLVDPIAVRHRNLGNRLDRSLGMSGFRSASASVAIR